LPPEESPSSRAELQKKLRKAHRKAKRHRHRWRRRIIYTLVFIVVIAVAVVGGAYFYAGYRYNEIKKVHAPHLVKEAPPGKPFNMLFVGSDSRAFVGDNTALGNEVGNSGDAGGQRSDVTMVARFVPATKSVTVLSIPRDLWVDIPANSSDISGMNRINAAFNSGPDLLIQTIEQVLGIPINHYMAVNFPGFTGMVNALGGVYMDFPTAVRDSYTGLDVTTLGCQSINGVTALQLVRSRHLQYVNANGYWEGDGLSDFSRIQRQDSFFRAVLAKVNQSDTNPFALNGFISAAVSNLTIDDTLSESDLLHIAGEFKGLQSSHLITETLPTTSFVTNGGADVLLAAQPYADNMIAAFNQIGLPPASAATPTTTTTTPVPSSTVSVNVLNASGGGELASETAQGLKSNGFVVTGINNAPSVIASGDPSEIFYGPTGLPAAHTLGDSLNGPVTYVASPSLTGNNLTLWVANAQLTVTTTTTTTSTTTTTTIPGSPTTTTTIPGDVYTNTQAEPWNPVPCTPAPPATTTTSSTTTTTVASAKKGASSGKDRKAAKPT
jgi:LCP family protein required for cell wall assembly